MLAPLPHTFVKAAEEITVSLLRNLFTSFKLMHVNADTELRPTWKPHPSCSHHLRRAEFTIKESGLFFPKQTQTYGANKIIIGFCTSFMSNKQMEFKFYVGMVV